MLTARNLGILFRPSAAQLFPHQRGDDDQAWPGGSQAPAHLVCLPIGQGTMPTAWPNGALLGWANWHVYWLRPGRQPL